MAFVTGFTALQLAQLEKSLATGVLSVEHDGKKTTFQSLAQMMALRDRIKTELAQVAATGPVPCMTRPTFFHR